MAGDAEHRPSVAEAVRRTVDDHPSILDCVKMDIVNYTALANLIQEEVASQAGGKRVSIEAIKMGLVRYGEEVRKSMALRESEVRNVLAKSVLELKNDVVLITMKQQPLLGRFHEIFSKVGRGRFFQLTQGTETFTLTVDRKILSEVLGTIEQEYILRVMEDQSAITLISPAEIITTPGVVAYITEMLSRIGINLTQIISCHTDTILIVKREDALRAYEIIEKKILSLRGPPAALDS
jgi:aspartokinase